MPSFNRRGFLHLLGAAGVTPLLPSGAVAARVAPANLSASKALWAGIYKTSGSASKFVGVARGMGLSQAAVQGVGARSAGVRIALGAAAQAPRSLQSDRFEPARALMQDIKRVLSDEIDDLTAVEQRDDTPSTPKPD